MHRLCPWLLISFLIAFRPPLFPEDKTEQKPAPPQEHHEIVVTATRLETPAREVGSSVTVISGESLASLKREFILEALRESVGIAVSQNGGPGQVASVFLRGANSEHTLVLLDGVAVNDPINPSRSADLAHVFFDNIDRVEILRGPQSPLYGSDALAGVVNIITRRGRGPARLTLGACGGSYGTYTGQAAVSGSTDRLDYSLGVSGFATRGISAASSRLPGNSERDGCRDLTFSGRIGVELKKGLELEVIGRSIHDRTNLDSFGGAYGDDPNNRQDYSSFFGKVQLRALLLGNRWEQKLALSAVDSHRTNDNPVDALHPQESESGVFKGRLLSIDWQNNFFLSAAQTVTAGVEARQEQGESDDTYVYGGFESPSRFPLERASTFGLYLQDSIRLADRFYATAGLRYDRHSRAGDAVTCRLAPAYIIAGTGTKIRASLATGFKAPSIYQLYAPGTVYGPIGNRSLRPEKVVGWDAGVDQTFLDGRLRCSLTYFRSDFENLIDFSFSQGYINVGRALSRGIEAEFEARPGRDLSLSLLLTHLDARDTISGERLLRRPENTLSIIAHDDFMRKWGASVMFDYVGSRRDVAYSGLTSAPVLLSPYALVNGVLTYQATPDVELFARLDNALNARYEVVFGYGTPGASLQVGARLTL